MYKKLVQKGMPKLKKCPHCGGKIEFRIHEINSVNVGDIIYKVTPTCAKCESYYPPVEFDDIREDVRNAFMTRLLREWVQ